MSGALFRRPARTRPRRRPRPRGEALSSGGMRTVPLLLSALLCSGSGCGRVEPSVEHRVEFQEGPTAGALRSGWSGFEKARDGTTFVWAEGTESSLRLGKTVRSPHEIRLRTWSFAYPGAGPQVLTLFVNDNRVGTLTLSPAPAEYSLSTPWSVWKEDENVVRFRFSRADPPALRVPGATDARPLAAAFDWVRIQPRPGVRDR